MDVDHWIAEYNESRPHSGKYCFGKTPMQTFRDSKHLADEKTLDKLSLSKEDFSGSSDVPSQLQRSEQLGEQFNAPNNPNVRSSLS
jgi:hypothetical protein